jgi:hypothetical protein
MIQKYLLVAALVTLAGCSTFWKGKQATSQGSAASGSTASAPAAPQPAGKSILPDWMTAKSDQPGAKVPPMAASRRINEQDCTTGGVDFTAGNLRCK